MKEQKSHPRILVIGPTPPPYNGMSVTMDILLGSSIAEQFELILLDTADRRGLTNVGRFDWHNVTLALRHGLSFLWLLISRRPDIAYISIAQNTLGYLRDSLFLIPAKLTRRKVVVHLHGSNFRHFYENAPEYLRFLIRWSLSSVSRAIVLGERVRDVFDGLVPDNRVVSVPNGISLDVFDAVQDPPTQDDEFIHVAYLGALDKRKGYIDLLHAAALVVQEYPTVCFHFAGGQSSHTCWDEAQNWIEERNLGKHVVFEGVLTGIDKIRFLKQSSIFAFPSWNEGLPYVILEAMSAGLPVVTTDVGCIPDVILDGVNGFIVSAHNPEAIAEKLLLLVKNRELRTRMGKASEARLRKAFTIDRWVQSMQQVFDQALVQGISGCKDV